MVTSSRSSALSHSPRAFASSTMARPSGRIRPSAISRSTRALFDAAQTLPGLRGVKRSMWLSSSMRRSMPSIQPKQRASTTASS